MPCGLFMPSVRSCNIPIPELLTLGKTDALLGQTIQVGCPDLPAETSQIAETEICKSLVGRILNIGR